MLLRAIIFSLTCTLRTVKTSFQAKNIVDFLIDKISLWTGSFQRTVELRVQRGATTPFYNNARTVATVQQQQQG
jgi:hypothetical protein